MQRGGWAGLTDSKLETEAMRHHLLPPANIPLRLVRVTSQDYLVLFCISALEQKPRKFYREPTAGKTLDTTDKRERERDLLPKASKARASVPLCCCQRAGALAADEASRLVHDLK